MNIELTHHQNKMRNQFVGFLGFLILAPINGVGQGLWQESWETASIGAHVPDRDQLVSFIGDTGAWLLSDSAEACGPSPNRAEIVLLNGKKVLRITSNPHDDRCAANLWVAKFPVANLAITPGTMLSITQTGRLLEATWSGLFSTVAPPVGDNVHFRLYDNQGNRLVYIFQRAPNYTEHTTTLRDDFLGGSFRTYGYHEIFLGLPDSEGGTYVRNLFEDFSQVPGFSPSSAKIVDIVYYIQSEGVATVDELKIGLGITATAPEIIRQPTSQVTLEGEIVHLSVAASGTSPFSYQWQHNGEDIDGATKSELVLENVDEGNSGIYRVGVLNSVGVRISDDAQLIVIDPPTIVKPEGPVKKVVEEGKSVEFFVEATGTEPLRFQWMFNGGNLNWETEPVLNLGDVAEYDSGEYMAIVTNDGGDDLSNVMTLTVVPQPSVQLAIDPAGTQFQMTIDGKIGQIVRVDSSDDLKHWKQLWSKVNESGLISTKKIPTEEFDQVFFRTRVVDADARILASAYFGDENGEYEANLAEWEQRLLNERAATESDLRNIDPSSNVPNAGYAPREVVVGDLTLLQSDDQRSAEYDGVVKGRLKRLEEDVFPFWEKENQLSKGDPSWHEYTKKALNLYDQWLSYEVANNRYLLDQFWRYQVFDNSGKWSALEIPSELAARRETLWNWKLELIDRELELAREADTLFVYSSELGVVSGQVWEDLNGNGIKDENEGMLKNVAVFLDSDGDNQFDNDNREYVFESADTPKIIPDFFESRKAAIESQMEISGVPHRIAEIAVALNLEYNADHNLNVYLVSPLGVRVRLVSGLQGSNHGSINITFEDLTERTFEKGRAVLRGTFQPDSKLNEFSGESANGIWTLEIEDVYEFSDGGKLNSWSLVLETGERETMIKSETEDFHIDLHPGFYSLAVIVPKGFKQSYPRDSGMHAIAVNPFQLHTSVDFGLFPVTDPNFQPEFHPVLGQDFVSDLGLEFVSIPNGSFTMGSPSEEKDRGDDEGPQTQVLISRGFWMGKHELTQRQYEKLIGDNPSQFIGNLDRPVENVSWNDAVQFCEILTEREQQAGRIPEGYEYRLPTEAEWEYVCRAGTKTAFSYGPDLYYTQLRHHAWYLGYSGANSHPVGEKESNPWGLYDMHGNISELCLDGYENQYPGGSVSDLKGSLFGSFRIVRGGNWSTEAWNCRAADRQWVGPADQSLKVGFRVVLAPRIEKLRRWTLELLESDGGAVDRNPRPEILEYGDGAQLILTAIPEEGWRFVRWTGDLSGSESPITITVNSDKAIGAEFSVVSIASAGDFLIPELDLPMVAVSAGSFTMGNRLRGGNELPLNSVVISKDFWMGKYEVTQGQYEELIGDNPSQFDGDLNRPVENVSWYDADRFCKKLTRKEHQAGRLPDGYVYSLPTEAQWEYSCRAGTLGAFSFIDIPFIPSLIGEYAWYEGNSGGETHPIGKKKPNEWGLFGMHGNVREWCLDWYGPYPGTRLRDPNGPLPSSKPKHVIRGGGWDLIEWFCASTFRTKLEPWIQGNGVGFRVTLVPGSSPSHVLPEIGLEMVAIPPGTFTMGSPATERGRSHFDEGPQTVVTITRPFWMGKYEVTQREYETVTGSNPSSFKGDANLPVVNVNWYEAVEFCRQLTDREHEAGRLPEGYKYRLPTEAEWEYSCRAGTTTPFAIGDRTSLSSTHANFNGIYPYGGAPKGPYLNQVTIVGSYVPNAWGLFDMHGNAGELCLDGYDHPYPGGHVVDPLGPFKDFIPRFRVSRGGSSLQKGEDCRSAARIGTLPEDRLHGFRIVLIPVADPNLSPELNPDVSLEFVSIPNGSFTMGSPEDELGRSDDETQHSVIISRGFLLGATEVTYAQWNSLLVWAVGNGYTDLATGGKGAYGGSTEKHPVTEVNWYDVVKWCNALSEKDGRTPVYTVDGSVLKTGTHNRVECNWDGNGYRLPTEAEWEYACRAGTMTAFYTGKIAKLECEFDPNLDRAGWYCRNYGDNTHPVGEKEKNNFGLSDMHGSVWEWCWDRLGDYGSSTSPDPKGSDEGFRRMMRGGSWGSYSQQCRSAYRGNGNVLFRSRAKGFRLCLRSSPSR